MTAPSFYITTAIDYVNGEPHLGHAYERITSDVIARWRRLRGDDVRFLTGTDEHGIKIEQTAAEAGKSPQEYVDGLAPVFQKTWDELDISYDRFIRTTDPDHQRSVVALLERIRDGGHLAERTYTGWYCDGCEAFKTDKDFEDEKCPDHPTRERRWLEEDNLFFLLSNFEQRLLDHIEAKPGFIEPESRRNEVLGMLKEGLHDLSISRSDKAVSWGIPIPFREDSVVYVWFDALINYLTGAGFSTDPALYDRRWPADLQVVGKDITRFHCIIWPAMLMAAGLPLPKKVFAHGWVTVAGEKMSKSSGVAVDPRQIAQSYGPDSLRYFLVSEVTFGRDGEFSWQRFEEVYTAHLANGLGNLLSRSVGMAHKYFSGTPSPASPEPDTLLSTLCEKAVAETSLAYDELRLHDACSGAWRIISTCNEQIQSREPWKMAKDESRSEELASFLYGILESLRIASVLLSPVLPGKTRDCLRALGISDPSCTDVVEATQWGGLPRGQALERPQPLFPRIDQLVQQAD